VNGIAVAAAVGPAVALHDVNPGGGAQLEGRVRRRRGAGREGPHAGGGRERCHDQQRPNKGFRAGESSQAGLLTPPGAASRHTECPILIGIAAPVPLAGSEPEFQWTGTLPNGYEAMTILADDRVLLTRGFPRAG
jgi:hypothetical protein